MCVGLGFCIICKEGNGESASHEHATVWQDSVGTPPPVTPPISEILLIYWRGDPRARRLRERRRYWSIFCCLFKCIRSCLRTNNSLFVVLWLWHWHWWRKMRLLPKTLSLHIPLILLYELLMIIKNRCVTDNIHSTHMINRIWDRKIELTYDSHIWLASSTYMTSHICAWG